MDKKLIALVTFVAIMGAAYFSTRAPSGAEGPEKDEAYFQNVVTDLRAMTPEGENGEWSDQQLILATLSCKDLAEWQATAETVPEGYMDIIEICGSVHEQREAQESPPT